MDIFSQRLKWARENAGLSQKEMAEEISMSPQGYGKIENGQREPNLESLAKLPHILKETTDFLLGVTEIDTQSEIKIKEFRSTLKFINSLKHDLTQYENHDANIPSAATQSKDIIQKQIDSDKEVLKYFIDVRDDIREILISTLKKVPGNEGIAEEIVNDIELEERLEFNFKHQ